MTCIRTLFQAGWYLRTWGSGWIQTILWPLLSAKCSFLLHRKISLRKIAAPLILMSGSFLVLSKIDVGSSSLVGLPSCCPSLLPITAEIIHNKNVFFFVFSRYLECLLSFFLSEWSDVKALFNRSTIYISPLPEGAPWRCRLGCEHYTLRLLLLRPHAGTLVERHNFYQIARNTGESTCDFVDRVKRAARNCEFRDQTLNMVRDKLVLNYPDQTQAADDGGRIFLWTTVKLALMFESIQSNCRTIANSCDINRIANPTQAMVRDKNQKCRNCGRSHELICPAKGQVCRRCGKKITLRGFGVPNRRSTIWLQTTKMLFKLTKEFLQPLGVAKLSMRSLNKRIL